MSEGNLHSLCVFCGSSLGHDAIFREAAELLGKNMARNGVNLVYGGGRAGLMGVLAQSVMESGGTVIGVIPRCLQEAELAFHGATELLVVKDMHSRKMTMFDRSDAFCVLPGGLGTLDETCEILTWKQLGFHQKPVIIANIYNYWQDFMGMVDRSVAAGYSRQSVKDLYHVVDNVADILPALYGDAIGHFPSWRGQ